jgi:hypothetical protein
MLRLRTQSGERKTVTEIENGWGRQTKMTEIENGWGRQTKNEQMLGSETGNE